MSNTAETFSPEPSVASYRFTRQIFLRALAVIYFIAFASLYPQIDGLIGSNGILPIRSFLQAAGEVFGKDRFLQLPTLCWLNSSDAFLHFLYIAGMVASVLVVAGIVQLPSLIVLYGFYLSLTIAGQDFLGYQWDILLLEAGFLAIFFAPLHPLAWRSKAEPPRIILWLIRWLLFRLMFMSGVVKLSSHDPNWHSFTALQYHYLTQPLPTWTSWYMYQLPHWFQVLSCAGVFFVELVVPFLIFSPRITRLIAFWTIIAFQLLITATGNYGFFNLLTIVLCFTLPDDRFWRRLIRIGRSTNISVKSQTTEAGQNVIAPPTPPRLASQLFFALVAIFLLFVTIPVTVDAFGLGIIWPRPLIVTQNAIAPFRFANGYGLFAIMTTTYRDIVIEGSNDGETWKPYVFKYKPQDLNQRPRFATPHMPRLDWQMWFASLGDASDNPWFIYFLSRLVEGSPAVLNLLESNPFPDAPPRYIRATLYEYKFTDAQTRRATGEWWQREKLGVYFESPRQ